MGTVDGILGCARAGLGITLMPRGVASRAASEGEIKIISAKESSVRPDSLHPKKRRGDIRCTRSIS